MNRNTDNPMPSLKHLDAAIEYIISANDRESARKAIEAIVEWRDWKRDHEEVVS